MNNTEYTNAACRINRAAVTAVLAAALLLMSFTPLGYLRMGAVSMSLLMIPAAIGGAACGQLSAAVLAALFGISSLAQCFGADSFGTALMQISPLRTALICLLPRILAGILTGIVGQHTGKLGLCSYAITGSAAAACNSVLSVSTMLLCFWHDPAFRAMLGRFGISGSSVFTFYAELFGFGCIFEAAVSAAAVFLIGWLMERAGMITVINPFDHNQKGLLHR